MNIIVHGKGAMGKILKSIIEEDDNLNLTGFTNNLKDEKGDVIIDFSHFSLLSNMLDYATSNNIPVVICTTGYDENILKKIEEASKKIPIVLASNTSIGINLMNEIVAKVSQVLNSFDIEIVEAHHNKKIDSPSGTAKTLYNTINKALENKMTMINGREGIHKREKTEIGMHSIRGGTVVGEHSVIFFGDDESIEIKHRAMSKKIFANGAIKASHFILNKEPNLYQMNDILK